MVTFAQFILKRLGVNNNKIWHIQRGKYQNKEEINAELIIKQHFQLYQYVQIVELLLNITGFARNVDFTEGS